MSTQACRLTVAFVALTAVSSSAGVENPGWFLRNQVAARINPFGLFDEARLGYRFAFEHAPIRSVGVAANASMSPSFARGGVTLDTQVTTFFTLLATYEAGGSFGNLGLEQSFPSAAKAVVQAPDPALMFERTPGAYAAARQQLILGAQLNASWRWVVFKAYCRAVFQHASLRAGDHVFYDANWDVLFPNDGWLTVNDVDLLVQALPGLRLGVRYNFTHAFIVPEVAGVTTQRVGPLISYLFFEHRHAAFNAPTISLVVNWRLERPLTANQSPFIPFVGLAFSFRSEL